ncbi:MAG: SIMPL domain-containing protein [Candidatus Fermentibacteria bacterium]
MKITGTIVLLVILWMTGTAIGQDYCEYPGTITSTGSGTAGAEPDVASVVFGVNITRSDPGLAVNDAAQLVEAAMAAARAEGVAGADMQTTSYSLWVQEVWDDYDYEYTGEMEYAVTHYVKADIRDISSVGDVLAAVVSAGANSINGVSFYVEDTASLYEDARNRASEHARDKAEQLADSFGVTLGEISSISEWTSYYADYGMAYDNYGGGLGYYAESPPVTPGAYSVSVEVSVTYEIVQ